MSGNLKRLRELAEISDPDLYAVTDPEYVSAANPSLILALLNVVGAANQLCRDRESFSDLEDAISNFNMVLK